ncbi:MAG: uracil-DNA glycosylase [Deltaproteobacteria bacterium]|nr:uracil-DNA glycosylase [Deltaproteobacteria bacterium]
MDPKLNRLLHFYRSIGIREIFVPPDLADALGPGSVRKNSPGRPETLGALQQEWAGCTRCNLSENRHLLVFGEGNETADLMFVGEGPGRDEDRLGRPFVGLAGELLTKIIRAMDLLREEIYITNVVKCRPPRNRTPFPEEIETCNPCLRSQIRIIRPKIICALGLAAAQTLLQSAAPISILRGRFHSMGEIRVMPTYHPAYLLRNPSKKKDVWDDMKQIMGALDLMKKTSPRSSA